MIRRPDYRPSAYDDDWEDAPASGAFPTWIAGVAMPLLSIGYGVGCFITRHGVLPGRGMGMHVYGPKAVALGIASIGVGLLLHFHHFWGNTDRLAAWTALGKIASLIGIIASLGYLIVRTFTH